MDIEGSISIARQPADVFAFVADVRNDPQWHTDILEASLTDDAPVHAGSTFAIKFRPFMGQSQGTTTVASYEPPRRVVMTGVMGNMKPTLTLSVEPEGSGSRFSRRVQMQPPGVMRIMAPFMAGWMRRHNHGFLVNLKRVLESGS